MPQHKNPCPGSHEIYNFSRSFLGHYYYTLSLSEQALEKGRRFFKKYINFTAFIPKLHPLGMGGHEDIYNFLSFYPTDAT